MQIRKPKTQAINSRTTSQCGAGVRPEYICVPTTEKAPANRPTQDTLFLEFRARALQL
jgi:hypothetical protein